MEPWVKKTDQESDSLINIHRISSTTVSSEKPPALIIVTVLLIGIEEKILSSL